MKAGNCLGEAEPAVSHSIENGALAGLDRSRRRTKRTRERRPLAGANKGSETVDFTQILDHLGRILRGIDDAMLVARCGDVVGKIADDVIE